MSDHFAADYHIAQKRIAELEAENARLHNIRNTLIDERDSAVASNAKLEAALRGAKQLVDHIYEFDCVVDGDLLSAVHDGIAATLKTEGGR